MMGLQEASRFVEYMPDDQLAREVQAQTIVPSYVALAEVARRNDMRNSQQNPPQQSTVAESEVNQLMGLGSAGISSNQPLSSPMGESPVGGDVPAPSGLEGMQMMAQGGITGYNEGGMSYYDRALGAIKGRYTDDDGLDYSQIGTDLLAAGLTFGPAGLIKKGYGLLKNYKKIGAGIQGAYQAGLRRLGSRESKKLNPFGPKPRGTRSNLKPNTLPTRPGYYEDLGRAVVKRNIPRALGAGYVASQFMGDDEVISKEMEDDLSDTQPSVDSGIGAISRDTEASIDPFDMARMGFALMGARDTSELAKGLSGIAEDIQTRRREAPLVKAQLAEIQAKVNYYNSQGQYGLADQLYKLASSLSAQISALLETGNAEEAGKVAKRLAEVNRAYGGELGIQSPSEEDVIARNMAD